MKSVIYYFSGTGNSLDIARKISGAVQPQAEVIPIASLYQETKVQINADVVGFVFPIYMGDAPWVVKEFVKKMHFLQTPYLYAVATCNGNPRNCLPIFGALLETRSQMLSFGEILLMPGNAKISSDMENKKRLIASEAQCITIVEKVNCRIKESIVPQVKLSTKVILGSPRKRLALAFTHFKVSSSCNGCGTCQKICPMGNIELHEKKPVWKAQCAACLACFHWCPQKAITFPLPILGNRPSYHHPDVTAKDIAAQQFKGK